MIRQQLLSDYRLKWNRIQEAMRQIGADGCLIASGVNLFYVSGTMYSGYCYFDKRVNRRKAVITPEFEVSRLRQRLDETDVDFEYFTETIKGPPEYLGKKHYFGHVTIPLNQREMRFSGRPLELKVPNAEYGAFEIYLGLELSPEERKYNNRTFDIKYRFEENH